MKQSMILIKLNEVAEKKGRSLYWLSRNADIPYVTLWNMSQKESQSSISLPVLSKLCTALECKPGDLLEYVIDAEDTAIASLIKSKAASKKSRKGSAK
jgi:putative transcriptional regulator